MVERPCLPREQKLVSPSLVLNIDPTFFDIYVWGTVFTHRTELDNVTRWGVLNDGPNDIESCLKIVIKCRFSFGETPHRVGR